MRRAALDVVGCPSCSGRLGPDPPSAEDGETGTLRCPRDGHEFPVVEGVPRLVRPEDVPEVARFADSYARTWAKDGWGASDAEYLNGLPFRDSTGRRSAEWRVKARSMEALFRFLGEGPPMRVADLGCGMGWLSHHLASRGHEVYAVDVLLDDSLGLGAAGTYARAGPFFERVWGEMVPAPFQSAQLDLVVCNASLHYAPDLASAGREISRILRPGGRCIVMNSPVYRTPESALRAETDFRKHLSDLGGGPDLTSRYHHLLLSDFIPSLTHEVGEVTPVEFDPGRWFRLSRRMKGAALRMELAAFPMFCVTKPASSARG